LLRVMVEGENQQLVEQSAQRIADVVRKLAFN
jgi:DNA-directed RNA polymerase subunit F